MKRPTQPAIVLRLDTRRHLGETVRKTGAHNALAQKVCQGIVFGTFDERA